MGNKPLESGDKLVIDGTEYFAGSTSEDCIGCIFYDGNTIGAQNCGNTPCGNIVWLTKLDYIALRLTS